jgi:GNAT superfamily N-acetyltransferase
LIAVADDPFPTVDDLEALWFAAWGGSAGDYVAKVLPRSLCHVGAYEDRRLVGFVNVAWDGGSHAFLRDTCVHPGSRRQGVATMLVVRAAELAQERGAEWLHVDYEPHLEAFYTRCGFRQTAAGLIRLA